MNDVSCLLHNLPSHRHRATVLPPMASPSYHQRPAFHPQDWPSHAHQPVLFAGALATSAWTNAGPSQAPSLWPTGPPDFLLPFHHYPPREYGQSAYSAARSDTSSVASRDSDLSPSPIPEVAEVVCNAPLVAPIPLPYHSPTFLLYDLPDEDEDLSHPPYTHRPHKRKRAREEDDADAETAAIQGMHALSVAAPPAKRRSVAEGASDHWGPTHAQWGNTGAASAALRHQHHPAAFSRRIRAR
ncbi:hypothetical protein BD309DRAFT_2247 [Dichomitus squalens]|nr:hypothetical protein BD309DRAFT_2247 [Dichomitus squalens]